MRGQKAQFWRDFFFFLVFLTKKETNECFTSETETKGVDIIALESVPTGGSGTLSGLVSFPRSIGAYASGGTTN